MGSRAWIVILIMGILGIGALGFLTNVAVNSNPELKKIIEFKAALASELEPRGVEEVSLKRSSRGAYEVRLSARPAGGDPALDIEVARFFAARYPDPMAQRVEVVRSSPARFGCGAPAVHARKEFELAQVRTAIAEEDRRARLAHAILTGTGCRLLTHERKGSEVRIEVEAPAGYPDDLARLARAIEPLSRPEVRGSPYKVLEIVVRPAAAPVAGSRGPAAPGGSPSSAPPAAAAEVRFDSRGSEIQRPAGSASRPRG